MSAIVELRQYTLKPGRRDDLIGLFEREFIETQEAEGIAVIGTFTDADDADRFVWVRGFPNMEHRAKSLAAFYGGPVWRAHRNAANDTMIDSDNVLLLRPAWPGSGFAALPAHAPAGSPARPSTTVMATICYFAAPVTDGFVNTFREAMKASDRAGLAAALVTESAANNFPALPVRESENVFAWFSRDEPAHPHTLAAHASRAETLRLRPTARSRLR